MSNKDAFAGSAIQQRLLTQHDRTQRPGIMAKTRRHNEGVDILDLRQRNIAVQRRVQRRPDPRQQKLASDDHAATHHDPPRHAGQRHHVQHLRKRMHHAVPRRVIGRQGRTASAVRTLAAAAGEMDGRRVVVDFRDD